MKVPDNSLVSIKTYFLRALSSTYGDEEALRLFYFLCDAWLGYSKVDIKLNEGKRLSESDLLLFFYGVKDLLKQRPVQYIAGKTWFYGLELKIGAGVLIPRPETEELVDWVVQSERNAKNVLDIGTGSGCIALAIKNNLKNAAVFGVDVSKDALLIAQENAKQLAIDVEFLELNILTDTQLFEKQKLDVIVSNPPYIPESDKEDMAPNVLHYEPQLALFVPNNQPLKFYQAVAEFGVRNLSGSGVLYFEIHESFGPETVKLLANLGYSNILVKKDLQGKDRMVRAELH